MHPYFNSSLIIFLLDPARMGISVDIERPWKDNRLAARSSCLSLAGRNSFVSVVRRSMTECRGCLGSCYAADVNMLVGGRAACVDADVDSNLILLEVRGWRMVIFLELDSDEVVSKIVRWCCSGTSAQAAFDQGGVG